MHLYEEKMSQQLIYDGKIIKVTKDQVRLENGRESVREVVHHSGGVCAAPLTKDGKLIFVRQFRYPFQKALLEFPAGKREAGEDPFEGVKRELKEEVGATAGKWIDLGQMYPTVAYDTEIIYLYLAAELQLGEATPDEGEFVDVETYTFDQALSMVMNNEIKDAKTIIMILKIAQLKAEGVISF